MNKYVVFCILLTVLCGCASQQTNIATPIEYGEFNNTSLEIVAFETTPAEIANESIALNFNPIPFQVMQPLDDDAMTDTAEWTYIKSIPFGIINEQDAALHLYSFKPNDATPSRLDGFLLVGDRSYHFTDLSLQLDESSISCYELCLYQKYFSKQQQFELIGSFALSANGPGLVQYVVYDAINDSVLTFDAWGSAQFIDLDHDTLEEFVIQFEGLHLSFPDLVIIDVIDHELKISYSVFEKIEKQQGDFALLKVDEQNYTSIYISNIVHDEHNANGYSYNYVKGQLKLINQ